MLFKDNFFTIIDKSAEADNFVFSIKLDSNHSIFSGHFPGNPVTPGVVQMEIIKELTSIAKEVELNLIKMSSCKFLAILDPNKNPKVSVQLQIGVTERNDIKVSAMVFDEDVKFLKMSAEYSVN